MRNLWTGALAAPLLMAGLAIGADKAGKAEAGCGSHGTTIDFVDTPNDAAKQAKKEGKLVLILHVSGNFEDPRFT
jgi:hypothetical protein